MRTLLALLIAAAPAAAQTFDEAKAGERLPAVRRAAAALDARLESERAAPRTASVEQGPHHVLWRGEAAEPFTSPSYAVEAFENAVMSWNVKGAAVFELETDGRWFVMGKWGDQPRSVRRLPEVNIDIMKLAAPASRLRFRVTPAKGSKVTLVAVTFWRNDDHGALESASSPAWGKKPLDVPLRSQPSAKTCSPTSLSMVLQFWGFNKPTTEVASGVLDHAVGLYGNWPFNTAYAHKLTGMEAFVLRMGGWKEVENEVAAGHPTAISVIGPPLFSNNGHFLVVVGFTEEGDVIVNDPAKRGKVRRTYKRAQLFNAWQEQHSGIAYVVRPRAQ